MDIRARVSGVLVFTLALTACSRESNPAQPTASVEAPETADATASVTVPRLVSPAAGAQIRDLDQPVTLVISNAVITQSGTPTYTFEVARDGGFSNKVFTKEGVAQGSGQTRITLDRLTPASDYYWRARAEGGGTIGPFTNGRLFTIGPPIVINAATPFSPIAGAQTDARPTLTVTNATRSGPVGPLTYRFEIATNPGFSPVAITATLSEGITRTSFVPSADLPAETTIFWRVTVLDQTNGITGPTTAAASFTTTFAIDLTKVVYLNSPDISGWRQTGVLELVEQDGAGDGPLCTLFFDPGWPDSPWPYGGPDPNFGVFANQWYFAKINGTWYGGAGEWIYRGAGRCKAGQGTRTIGPDAGFGAPFNSWVPRVGELVGYAVSSVARPGVKRTVDERTNVLVQPWRDTSLGSRAIGRSR